MYDPQSHDVVVDGTPIVGFAEGTFIKASFNEPQWSLKVGSDGFATRVRNANRSGKIEITLMASSPSNDYLNGLAQADRDTGAGIVPTLVKDRQGTARAQAGLSWINQIAPLERGKDLPDITWEMETNFLEMDQGGALVNP